MIYCNNLQNLCKDEIFGILRDPLTSKNAISRDSLKVTSAAKPIFCYNAALDDCEENLI